MPLVEFEVDEAAVTGAEEVEEAAAEDDEAGKDDEDEAGAARALLAERTRRVERICILRMLLENEEKWKK